VETFFHRPAEDYFLMVSELVPYKRLDYAVRFFARTGRRLKIAGDGPEFKRLRKIAGGAVEFCGRVSDQELWDLYARCRALVVPGEEDFGITMVEALASGKPVIALGRGGSVEIVPEGGGVLYDEAREERLEEAVTQFEGLDVDVGGLQKWAARFSEARFAEEFLALQRESGVGSRESGAELGTNADTRS
jgi:glycosyltransferase involved in cell wall biosynthesis